MNDNGSLLNLADPMVRALIAEAKKHSFVTLDQLNSVLPSGDVTSNQLEATLEALAQMGINLTED
jgi:RNA polymerase primary sigma factor